MGTLIRAVFALGLAAAGLAIFVSLVFAAAAIWLASVSTAGLAGVFLATTGAFSTAILLAAVGVLFFVAARHAWPR